MLKSYIWWTDEPWAALLALAALIIVVGVVSIIVVVYTYSRYTKFSNSLRMRLDSLKHPRRDGPRTVRREYETQSLNIYVPHDDAISDVTDFKMAFAETSMEFLTYADQRSKVAEVVSDGPKGVD